MSPIPAPAQRIEHLRLMLDSFQHWTGRPLTPDLPSAPQLAEAVFHAPWVLVSHGTETDPILNYGNRRALELWELTWEELTQMPSRLTAEPVAREERARLLERVRSHGYIDDYSGVRVTKSGRRFRIRQAIVWNLIHPLSGRHAGQAAWFDQWEWLPSAPPSASPHPPVG